MDHKQPDKPTKWPFDTYASVSSNTICTAEEKQPCNAQCELFCFRFIMGSVIGFNFSWLLFMKLCGSLDWVWHHKKYGLNAPALGFSLQNLNENFRLIGYISFVNRVYLRQSPDQTDEEKGNDCLGDTYGWSENK